MNTTLIEELRAEILGEVPGCPEPVVDQQIRAILREFFSRTRVWKGGDIIMTREKDVTRYCLELDPDLDGIAEINEVATVWFDDSTGDDVDSRYEVDPMKYAVEITEDGKAIVLDDKPSTTVDAGLIVQVSLRTPRNVTAVPTFLFDEYASGWSAGVRARIYRLAGKKSYNSKVTIDQRRAAETEWNNLISRVRTAMMREFAPRQLTRKNPRNRGIVRMI